MTASATEIRPVHKPLEATVRVPGSKSITNRALILAALCQGTTELSGVLFADDTRQMINALESLGYRLEIDRQARVLRMIGRGAAIPAGDGRVLACGNSGTTIRFLAAMLTLGSGEYVLDGVTRMRQRPIDQLVEQLGALGAGIAYDLESGFPPIRLRARGLNGGICRFSDARSSQYISAVLMAAPYAAAPVTIQLVGPITSEPYVRMTLRMMEQFGIAAQVMESSGGAANRDIRVPCGVYRPPPPGVYAIEPDASNASYFLAAAAIVPGSRITVAGLARDSLQGDVAFAEVLGRMGAVVEWRPEGLTAGAPVDGLLHGIELDMNHIPDMVQTLCVVALFADGPTTVRNVWNLRVKETDRLAALRNELSKLGAAVETGRDWIRVIPPTPQRGPLPKPVSISTYDDHRMAMAFAVAGLRPGSAGIRIEDPDCCAKTYPDFFADLQSLTANM